MERDRFAVRPYYALLPLLICGLLTFANCGGSSSSDTTNVVSTISVSPATSSVGVAGQITFTAIAKDSSGNTLSGQTFTWASSASNIASITSDGVATGLIPGTTQITAAISSVTSSPVTLTVNPPTSAVSLSPTSANLRVGETQQFTATAKDASGNPVTGAVFSWFNSSAGVASISSTGLVTAISPGTAVITATANNVTSPAATVNVAP